MRTPAEILAETRTIALVGASPKPERPSNSVMRYLLAEGYRVIPVRPHRTEILGIPCVDSVTDIEEPVDLVDVFRRAEFCPEVAEQAAAAGAKALWLQLGIRFAGVAGDRRARRDGLRRERLHCDRAPAF